MHKVLPGPNDMHYEDVDCITNDDSENSAHLGENKRPVHEAIVGV